MSFPCESGYFLPIHKNGIQNIGSLHQFDSFREISRSQPLKNIDIGAGNAFLCGGGTPQLPGIISMNEYSTQNCYNNGINLNSIHHSQPTRKILSQSLSSNWAEFHHVCDRPTMSLNNMHRFPMNNNIFAHSQSSAVQMMGNQFRSTNPPSYAVRLSNNIAFAPGNCDSFQEESPSARAKSFASKKTWKVILTPELAATIYKFKPSENEKKSSSVRLSRRCPQRPFQTPARSPDTATIPLRRYGVSPKTIRDIWNRATWAKATRHMWEDADGPPASATPGPDAGGQPVDADKGGAGGEGAEAWPSRAEAISVRALSEA